MNKHYLKVRVPLDRLPTATVQVTLTRTILRKEIQVSKKKTKNWEMHKRLKNAVSSAHHS